MVAGLCPRLVVVVDRPVRLVPALAVLVVAALLRPLRALVVPVRLLPVRLLAVPLRLRVELLAVRSLRLLLFRSLRLFVLPRAFRVPAPERSAAAVRVREVERESLDEAAWSWSIRCPASLVQLCDGTPCALSCRAKLFAAVSFGKGPTSRRFGPL